MNDSPCPDKCPDKKTQSMSASKLSAGIAGVLRMFCSFLDRSWNLFFAHGDLFALLVLIAKSEMPVSCGHFAFSFLSFIYVVFRTAPISQNSPNASTFTITTLAPAGVEYRKEAVIPKKKQQTDTTADVITTPLKLRQTRIAVSAGKMMRLEISIAPIMRIPTTIVTAVKNASSIL